ncbi:MAG: hypothetical protein [brine shrimp arlivirus 1]|nr:MAG: hypothetical protein [brine shrimp arlivirus 1]UNI74018.1 MAG: hypothetical protein [brine shrimp arlivirus 1]UNI74023.1 MAG: hypothetical protein [brine shrimp arlivirus 1]UNI74068.1 MAG: hypothetical protein [brine shrimp arlivirus 1]UNI74073.1 MAG: hypothetical protein [brine shrimp arlivirus 1]
MSENPENQQPDENIVPCRYHMHNYICPVRCSFPHIQRDVPSKDDDNFPLWLNMMLNSLKDNQRLIANNFQKHQEETNRRISAMEKQLKVMSEQISQFGFAQGVFQRPTPRLADRVTPSGPPAALEGPPEDFFSRRSFQPRRSRSFSRGPPTTQRNQSNAGKKSETDKE